MELKINEINGQYYLTDDSPIEEGDWCYDTIRNCIWKKSKDITCNGENYKKIIATTDKSLTHWDEYKDPLQLEKRYPRIPESLVKAYAEAGGIDEVMLEYSDNIRHMTKYRRHLEYSDNIRHMTKYRRHGGEGEISIRGAQTLKLNDDNTVIWSLVEEKLPTSLDPSKCRPPKRIYSREEVEKLCSKAFQDAREFNSIDGVVDIHIISDLPKDLSPKIATSKDWVKNNLKIT
jgi:hypothetical protein